MAGKGPLLDLSDQSRQQQQLDFLDSQIKNLLERREKITDAAARRDFDKTLAELKQRRAEQAKQVDRARAVKGRSANVRWVVLDSGYADDPAIKAEVLKVEPTYQGLH